MHLNLILLFEFLGDLKNEQKVLTWLVEQKSKILLNFFVRIVVTFILNLYYNISKSLWA